MTESLEIKPYLLISCALYLEQLLGKGDGNDARGAAHATQVVGDNVGPHLEVVDDHG